MKECRLCGVPKDLSCFGKHSQTRDRLRHECKECRSKEAKRYNANNREHRTLQAKKYRKEQPETLKRTRYLSRYGLSGEVITALINIDTPCDICGAIEKLHIDHDHTTMKVRGFLCGNCNRGLGLFNDSILFLERAIEYLRKPQTGPICRKGM